MEKGFSSEKINTLVDIVNDVLTNGLNCVNKYGVELENIDNVKFLINCLNKLTNNKHNILFEISIVRGQGYYTGTVYEFYAEGLASAIGGGGRYDKMVGKMIGVDVPAVGVSIGFERVALILKEKNSEICTKQNLALLYDEEDDIVEVFMAKENLMNTYNVSLYKRPKNIKNFYDKIIEVADCVTSFKDYLGNKEIKVL